MFMKISIQEEKNRFNNFISVEGNTNIVFSGKFGIGKTYFINEFFNDNERDFQKLYISPVNYSIANNEDIFEYIKVNILFQLLEYKDCPFVDFKPTFTDRLLAYIKSNKYSIIQNLLEKAVNIVGFNIEDSSSAIFTSAYLLSSLWDKAKKAEKVDNSTNTDKENIEEFVKKLSIQKGSIYENDIITQLIRQIIDFIKEKKQVVLVIDDLDRIDPEHIFRIVNILSAHDNFCESGLNKFGIDKTIIVCDISNIRNIYKAKYGIDVDFNGYIDKFYSKEIYHFDNTENIIKNVSYILCSMKSEQDDLINPKNFTSKSCQALLKALLSSNKLNLRTLLKIKEKEYENNRTLRLESKTVFVNDFISVPVFDFLKVMLGSIEELEEAILNLTASDIKSYEEDICIGLIALADYETNKFKLGEYRYAENINYTLENNLYPDIILDTHDFWIKYRSDIDPLEILKKAFKNYKNYCMK